MDSSLQYIQEYYRMPWLRTGLTVIDCKGQQGPITGFSGPYVQVQFPGYEGPANCHPQWGMTYCDEQGNVIADYKERKQS